MKEFRNNRKFYVKEEWQEFIDGKIFVKKTKDDGYGRVTVSEYGSSKKED